MAAVAGGLAFSRVAPAEAGGVCGQQGRQVPVEVGLEAFGPQEGDPRLQIKAVRAPVSGYRDAAAAPSDAVVLEARVIGITPGRVIK